MPRPYTAFYRVRKGDSLWSIAQRFYGDPTVWPQISAANNLPQSGLILVGMSLTLPDMPQQPQYSNPPASAPGSAISSAFSPTLAKSVYYQLTYDLGTIPITTVILPTGTITLSFSGEIALGKNRAMNSLDFSANGIGVSSGVNIPSNLQKQYGTEIGNLAKAKLLPQGDSFEVTSGFYTAAKFNDKIVAKSQFIPTPTGFIYTLAPAPIQGTDGDFYFQGTLGFTLEIQNQPPIGKPAPVPISVPFWLEAPSLAPSGAALGESPSLMELLDLLGIAL